MLYQNASSLEYMGDLLSGKYDNYLNEGLLQVGGWVGRVDSMSTGGVYLQVGGCEGFIITSACA